MVDFSLDHAVVYDCETIVNCFTLNAQGLHSDLDLTFEISQYRDDRMQLLAWFDYWAAHQIPMVGFNTISFDYPIIHHLYNERYASYSGLYDKAQEIITSQRFNRFGTMIWQSDRFAPQIDLMLVHHFDNNAKRTSLKALEVNMRSDTVEEMPVPHDVPISREDIDRYLIPYNRKDVAETKKFAHYSLEALNFRIGLMDTIRGDVINWNDSKIGSKLLEQRLGDDLCYDRGPEGKIKRQTPRSRIALNDIIFPYVQFRRPEFQRVLDWMRTQTISEDEVTGKLKTKGVFSDVAATVDGFEFHFGTGGIHGSVSSQKIVATDDRLIVDIDVASLYPNIAIQNGLYPEHLGQRFVEEYARLPIERKEWQAKKGKKCVEANAMKLAANGTYGNSNSPHSVFYDARFTMTITINGQLMLCMLAEWLLTVPTLSLVQINTDGLTYRIHPSQRRHAEIIRSAWERLTKLVLEEAEYSRMWIRDVNSYIAEDKDGKFKLKGAFWYPVKFPDDISNAQPPAWHKDFSGLISTIAAVRHMTEGVDIERVIYECQDPFLFCMRAKTDRAGRLYIGDTETQRILRYYVAHNGGPLRKILKPKGTPGAFKRKNGITDWEYHSVLQTLPPDTWDERIHSKNKARYPESTETGIRSGYMVADCCDIADFDWQNLNHDYYVAEAKKLVIS